MGLLLLAQFIVVFTSRIPLNQRRLEMSWIEVPRMALFLAWCLFVLLCWPCAMLARFVTQRLPSLLSKN